MRIVCHSVEDFLENLKVGEVFKKTVWVDTTRKKESESVESVVFQASAVLEVEGGEALLQYGEECGLDYTDGSAETEGTEKANENRGKILDWCATQGLTVKPGIVDM
jgi:hypothetical protein